MNKNDTVYLQHMREYAAEALEIAAGKGREDFETDRVLRYALLHLVQIVGEAARQVSPARQRAHPEIPWPDIIGTRNRLVHGYGVVDEGIIWETVERDLRPLIVALDRILGGSPSASEPSA